MVHGTIRRLCTLAFVVVASRATATELLPGETLIVSSIGQGIAANSTNYASDAYSSSSFEYLRSSNPIYNVVATYGSLTASINQDAYGNKEVIYSFQAPYTEGPPPIGIPYTAYYEALFPTGATVSIEGFGSGSVDVSIIPRNDRAMMSVGFVKRSIAGDSVIFGGFTQTPFNQGGEGTDGIAFIVPGKSFALSSATAALTDLEGNPREISVEAVGPVPELSSFLLLALGLAALGVRFGETRQVRQLCP